MICIICAEGVGGAEIEANMEVDMEEMAVMLEEAGCNETPEW